MGHFSNGLHYPDDKMRGWWLAEGIYNFAWTPHIYKVFTFIIRREGHKETWALDQADCKLKTSGTEVHLFTHKPIYLSIHTCVLH